MRPSAQDLPPALRPSRPAPPPRYIQIEPPMIIIEYPPRPNVKREPPAEQEANDEELT